MVFTGAFNPAYGVDDSFFPKPKTTGAADTLAMSRLYHSIYNKPPALDLSGISNVGEGISKAAQNILNAVLYGREQRAQGTYEQGLMAKAQQEADDTKAAQQTAFDTQQNAAQYKYDLLIRAAQGDKSPEVQAGLQLMGLATPVANRANAVGTEQGRQDAATVTEGAVNADPTINISPVNAQGQPIPPTPQAINNYQLRTGIKPTTNLDTSEQMGRITGQQINNATGKQQLSNLPTQQALENQGKLLSNQGQLTSNYVQAINAGFAKDKAQAELDSTRTSTATASTALQDKMAAQQLINQSIANGDLFDAQKLPALQAQLKSLGWQGDLTATYHSIFSNPNTKSSATLGATISKNYALPKPSSKSPAPALQALQSVNKGKQPTLQLPAPVVHQAPAPAVYIDPRFAGQSLHGANGTTAQQQATMIHQDGAERLRNFLFGGGSILDKLTGH